jgi:simple sugar transport system permease protein
MEPLTNFLKKSDKARMIIIIFFVLLFVLAFILKLPLGPLISDSLVRIGMNGVLVLAILVGVIGGIGLNFGIPIGIVAGLVGAVISMELNLTGWMGILAAIVFSVPISILMGAGYGVLLNNTKGDEMTVATYAGFSIVSLFSILWIFFPVHHPQLVWPIGQGIRTTISLDEFYGKIMDNFLAIKIGSLTIPTGTILFFTLLCVLVWIFLRSRTGLAMRACGTNPLFAKATGLNVNRYRMLSTILSTVLSSIGIIVYSQSYGFYQLYQAPLMMGFATVAAILIGGATPNNAKISNVIIGVVLFQGILTISMPVANEIIQGNLADVVRVLVSNGIILYALSRKGVKE